MPKVQIHEHTTSYQAITTKSPHGFICLKKLFLEYDNPEPSRAALESLFARDFTDNENESTRSIGREEAIEHIISIRQKCSRHQTDLKRAICIEHDDHKKQEVLFEGVRFMQMSSPGEPEPDTPMSDDRDRGDWTRVPFSGRLEVRVKENRFRLKDAVIEVVSRRTVEDKSALVKKDMLLRNAQITMNSMGPVSPLSEGRLSEPMLHRYQTASTSQVGLPPVGATELPAASATIPADNRSLPPYQSTGTRTPTEGSVAGDDKFGQVMRALGQPSNP